MPRYLTEEQLDEAVTAYEENGSITEAAKALSVPRTTMQHRLNVAAQTGRDHYPARVPPPGHIVKGVSTLYDHNGLPKSQWVKTATDMSMENVQAAIEEAFASYKGVGGKVAAPKHSDTDILTVYVIADLHLGMYAWWRETGASYDLDIASALLKDSLAQLIAAAPPTETAIVLNVGDFFHSDNNENRTRRAGNSLDVDTRYAKVLQTGVELRIQTADMARAKHKKVINVDLPGNHDPYAALALSVALGAFFSKDPRVEVVPAASPFFFYRFGKTMIGATHGDMAKAEDMPGIMAAMRPQDWGETEYRYAYLGHWHSKRLGGENGGASWEVFQTLAPKDAWNNAMGFVGGRSMTAIVLHKEKGEIMRHTVNMPRFAREVPS